ncbi:uncharacterized protein LY89DRAFT_679437 [Mollisia scopiformis]|uniref:Uncharacterized protein n=1 Tax=Mollisia scopiformis TaxID=149040 RepID=A0A194XW60_MOLSC|nr:uncharacterized protein LY89DRAFT_679437 [Mollisia scopiformis]KUJ24254.1 hypothetical protein LY89DRAFT_679437 [Mollisia scopiformis]
MFARMPEHRRSRAKTCSSECRRRGWSGQDLSTYSREETETVSSGSFKVVGL